MILKSSKQKPARILIVEDEEGIKETMKDILETEGYIVKASSSVKESKEMINDINFDMVISDLSLSDESGMALVDFVREKDKFVSFLLMTGYGTMETAIEAMKKNVDEYILKPVDPRDLMNKVKIYLDKYRAEREKDVLVGKLKKSNIKLLEISKTDELTGVSNRRYFFNQLYIEMQRAKRQDNPLALMMCDVDGFKRYNDTKGHIEGDKVLKKIAKLIKLSVRNYVDQIFRYGGDEFTIIVPEIERKNALKLSKRIIEKVRDKFKTQKVGLSIGISCYNSKSFNLPLKKFINIADKKLYKAKKMGGNNSAA
ncbi:MAG: diguanylate cyclase [Endomicrobiales bacterium]|nr:diguanylate cyclase [Endomicrobiales bacterium]